MRIHGRHLRSITVIISDCIVIFLHEMIKIDSTITAGSRDDRNDSDRHKKTAKLSALAVAKEAFFRLRAPL